MMDSLLALDASLFKWINSGLSNPIFDALLPWCREKLIWVPLYTFVITFIVLNYGKKAYFILICLLTTVVLADVTSSQLIKKNVERVRPCNEPDLKADLVLRVPCSSGYSFTSSHAANHGALAVFFSWFFGGFGRWIKPVAIGWAILVGFSQIYVGVHYPLDVVAGLIVGFIAASVIRLLAGKYVFT